METMEKKYRQLENDTRTVDGKTLYRIEALKDFAGVKKGDKGGYIESEKNLSQRGNCWVYEDACVFEDAWVYGAARVFGAARVYEAARIYENARVCEAARVFGAARVYEAARIYENARVCEAARVFGAARICGDAWVYGAACVSENACVYGDARVYGKAWVYGNARIRGTADYYVGKNVWSSGRYFTYTRSNKMWKVGCFYGTGEGLIAKAYRDSEVSGREYERVVKYVEAMYADLEKDKE